MTNQLNSDDIDERISNHIGVFIEHLNDQFERVLEAIDTKTTEIPIIAEKVRSIEKEVRFLKADFNLLSTKVDENDERHRRTSDDVEVIKANTGMQSLKIDTIQHNTKMLKLRSDQDQESKSETTKVLKNLGERVTKLELAK